MTRNACTIDSTPDTLGTATLRIRADVGAFMSNVVTLTFTIERQSNDITIAPATASIRFDETPTPNTATADSGTTAFIWSSSNTAVATIDASTGVITLVSAGMTTIEASTAQTATHKAGSSSYELTVTPFPPILPAVATMATVVSGIALADATIIANQPGGAEITDCKFIDTANSDNPVATLADLSIMAATNGRACEITGMLTGEGVQTGITVRALSTTGEDTATVVFTVLKPLSLVRQVDGGHSHTCAVSTDSELYCWGSGSSGILGLGNTMSKSIPTRVGTTTNWAQVSASTSHTCAVNTDGELYCWGFGTVGRLGLGNTMSKSIPTRVGTMDNWAQVSAGGGHTCAMNTDGELYCWGFGGNNQLGLDNTAVQNTPIRVGTTANWSQVSAGNIHTCAMNTDGELYCWGSGDHGRLGLGDTAGRSIPIRVGTTANWSQVSAGTSHTCAVNTDGELYCWGPGNDGRLGLGDTINRSIPTRVGTTANWSQVSAGTSHTCAVNTASELYCWGSGDNGRLGLSDTNARTTPTKVGTATNWSKINVGNSYTCAINATGQLHCWGSNDNGQLGLGDATERNAPQLVNTPRTPTAAPILANLIVSGSEAPARFNNGVFGAGNIIPPLTFTNTGGDVQPDGCAIDTTSSRPALPAGLRAHPIVGDGNITCQISGIPTEAATMATYYITATNAIGTSEAVTVSFQVDLIRPLLADIATEQSYTMGTAITPLTFTNTGLAVKATDGCTASQALPLGLTLAVFDDAGTMTCQITGTPEAEADRAIYVITATDSAGGTDEARVTITVIPLSLALLSTSPTEHSADFGSSISPITIDNSSTDPNAALVAGSCVLLEPTGDTALDQTTPGSNTYTINGLTLATDVTNNTCTVNGTPATPGATILRIRANTDDGMSEVLVLTVYARQDDTISFANLTVTITDDVVPANALTSTSTTPTYTWTSSVETVATIDPNTGSITITGAGATVITATSVQSDTYKSASAIYTLTITAFPPNLPEETQTADAVDNTLLAPPVSIANAIDAANIIECVFIDTANSDAQVSTLAGLNAAAAPDGRACEITGRLNGVGEQTFTIRALSATGLDDATVTFTVTPKP
ncbi:MAG: hypothetical protein K8963_08870, partial [Proteobacteria bacterium]|nr:hypothetical protein [Pseudomonadota bacterium]